MNGSYRDLEVYQRAHTLGVEVHRFALKLPKFELHETGSQLRRASKSISVNIVEGYGRRRYKSEFVPFLIYPQASCDETAEWLRYFCDCHEDAAVDAQLSLEKVEELGRKLNKFIQAVEREHRSEK